MPFYLMRFSYTPEAWARLIKQPEDRREVALEHVKMGDGHGTVDRAPVDGRLARRLLRDEFVVGGPSGVLAGATRQRAVGADHALAAPNRLFVQSGRREVALDSGA